MKINSLNESCWKFYALALIVVFIFILSLRWPLLPTFIDIYYHLAVMLGFNDAGGFVTKAFWEYAPVGRPHLYPPLLHLLMLIVYRLNLSALTVARLFEFIIYPSLLITLWWLVRRLFNSRLAFFTLLISLSIYPFYISTVNFIPSSLAMILAMWSLIFIERHKITTSSILLGLAFYAHAGMPWLFLVSFILYSLLNRKILKDSIKVIIFGFILALPILLYQYSFRQYVHLAAITERFPLEINLWLLLLFFPGVIISFKRKERYNFFIVLFIVTLLSIFSHYRYRFVSGQGMVSFIFLSSITVDLVYEKAVSILSKKLKTNLSNFYVFVFILICFLIFSPTFLIQDKKPKFYLLNSTYINLIPAFKKIQRPHEFSIYFPKFYKPIKDIIIENSKPDDIIYCNFDYLAGVFSVLTGRATSTAMLKEVSAYRDFDPINVSKLILWLKDPDKVINRNLNFVVRKYKLRKIKETELVYIYENPSRTPKRILSKPLLSNKLIFSILLLLIGLIGFEIIKK
jgi:hypothetical protein